MMETENEIVRLCAAGMDKEALGEKDMAAKLFNEAWQTASTDKEKAIAAHYVARQQPHIQLKLEWDEIALSHAKKSREPLQHFMPSLYLNIAKCHEDLNNFTEALNQYQLAQDASSKLAEDGYSNMILKAIEAGIKRVNSSLLNG